MRRDVQYSANVNRAARLKRQTNVAKLTTDRARPPQRSSIKAFIRHSARPPECSSYATACARPLQHSSAAATTCGCAHLPQRSSAASLFLLRRSACHLAYNSAIPRVLLLRVFCRSACTEFTTRIVCMNSLCNRFDCYSVTASARHDVWH